MTDWPNFAVPPDWSVIPVAEIADLLRSGGTPSRSHPEYWGGKIPFVLIEDITATGLYLDRTREFITESGIENSSAWLVPSGAVLLSMYATIGATAVTRIPAATNQAILAILPKKGYSAEFLAFCLRAHRAFLAVRNVQATQKNIGKGIVETFQLPVPKLAEQKKIAEILILVLRALDTQTRLISTVEQLKRRLLNDTFECELAGSPKIPVPLALLKFKVARDQQLPSAQIKTEGSFPVVDQGQEFIAGYTDVKRGVITDGLPVIIFGDHTRCVKYVDFPFVLGADGTKVLKPDETKFRPLFLYYAFTAFDIPSRGYNRHFTLLKERSVAQPGFDVQDRIVTRFRAVDGKLALLRKKRAALRSLFDTLLHQLMTAQVRVHDVRLPGSLHTEGE